MQTVYIEQLQKLVDLSDFVYNEKRKVWNNIHPETLEDWKTLAKIDKVGAIMRYRQKYNTNLIETKKKFDELLDS